MRTEDNREVHVRSRRSGDVFGEVAVGYWFNLFTKAIADRFLEKERQLAALGRGLERLTRKIDD